MFTIFSLNFEMEVFSNWNDVFFNYYFLIGGFFLSYLVYCILHSIFCYDGHTQTLFKTRGHSWRSIQCNKSIPYSIYCTVCGKLMLTSIGLFCECCGVSACKKCHGIINKKLHCKQLTWPGKEDFLHHWVDVGSTRGENSEQSDEGVKRYFCCWCQRIKLGSNNVLNNIEACDFQKYKSIIIPPPNVIMDKGVVTGIKPLDGDWEPLIVFANCKSGSNKGDEVLSLFRGLLNPIQVVDLSSSSPESVTPWLPARCRVLAAGGDGTVAWVLNSLLTVPDIKASVGILPLGTGNDLSRVLGWGSTCNSPLDVQSIINHIKQAEETQLDRWKITIKPLPGRLGRRRAERTVYAYNYASIGVDAQVALDFHRARTQFLYRYASRTLNYFAYAWLGATRALDDGGCGELERRVRVRLDGASRALTLPPLQALVVLNIPSWGAGVDLWRMGNEQDVAEQRINDGKFEVVGISSSFHIARLQCGLAEPYRFAQASRIKIELSGCCAMQVDGEPWMQSAATILVERAGQCSVLRSPANQT